jgi:Bacterial DNA-binding protein
VELRGFGLFTIKNQTARTGRDPRTGAEVAVCEKGVPAFKASRDMHHRLNPSDTVSGSALVKYALAHVDGESAQFYRKLRARRAALKPITPPLIRTKGSRLKSRGRGIL